MVLVYLQCLVGALVRHTGVGMACGLDLIGCADLGAPQAPEQWLHMAHRWLAYFSAAVIVGVAIWGILSLGHLGQNDAPGLKRRLVVQLTLAATALLVVGQIGIGFLSITSFINAHVVTAHLAIAALIFGSLVFAILALGRLGDALEIHTAEAAPAIG